MTNKQIKVILTMDGKQYAVEIDKASGKTRKLDDNTQSLNSTLQSSKARMLAVTGAVVALGGSLAARAVLRYADAWTNVNNQLLVNVDTNEAFFRSQQDVIRIALDTRTKLTSVASLYGRMTAASEELNASQEEIAKVTELAAKAIAIQGSTAGESSGALLQLSQLLGGNVVQAQEFNSLIDGARPLLVAVANGSDRFGGSVAKLREEVRAGTVTSKEFFDAALAGSDVISDKFDKAQKTISQGSTVFNTGLTVGIGTINEFVGTSEGLVDVMTSSSTTVIDFSKAVTGSLSPTDELSENMKVIATGAVLTASGLNLVGDVVRESISAPFREAGKNIGATAAALVAVSDGEFTLAADIIKLRGQDIIDIPKNMVAEFNKSAAEAGTAMDIVRELWDKGARDIKINADDVGQSFDKLSGGSALSEEAKKLNELGEKYLLNLQRQTELLGETTAASKLRFELEHGSLTKLNEGLKAQLRIRAVMLDKRNEEMEAEKKTEALAVKTAKDNEQRLKQLTDSLRTEKGIIDENYIDRLNALREFHEQQQLTDQEFSDLRIQLEAQHNDQLEDLRKKADGSLRELENAIRGFGDRTTDTLVDVFFGAKLEIGNILESIARDIVRFQIQENITNKLISGVSDFLPSFFGSFGGATSSAVSTGSSAIASGLGSGLGANFPIAHTGGIPGKGEGSTRFISPRVFDNAPRFHDGFVPGLKSGELPAIIKDDEGVFTPGQMKALGGSGGDINITNHFQIDGAGDDGISPEAMAKVAKQFEGMMRNVAQKEILNSTRNGSGARL
jgi:tape measure domain-containing protein